MTKKSRSRRNRDARGLTPARVQDRARARTQEQANGQTVLRTSPMAQAARIALDTARSQWDELNDMYLKMTALMDHWITRAVPVISNPVLLEQVEDKRDYSALLRQFRCDMEQLTHELTGLHALHAHRTGGTDDPNENLRAALIFERYVMWQLRHDQTLIPVVNHLLEFTHAAELALAKQRGLMPGFDAPASEPDAGMEIEEQEPPVSSE
ncbi:hypothetical protein [Paraburkholderia adhaesiva]|uniref:hypothetical protein n=1 Tax=Paraburkholderia adhaesiva TaxID=2883244 RepID=UPI001F19CE77|nr:hypothetical protein [Paraburkholderia adhaesiva]